MTKIIGGSKSDEQLMLLERWKRKQIALLGTEGFARWQRDRFALGHAVHREIEHFYQTDHNRHEDGKEEEAYLAARIDVSEGKAAAFLSNIQQLLLNQTDIKECGLLCRKINPTKLST